MIKDKWHRNYSVQVVEVILSPRSLNKNPMAIAKSNKKNSNSRSGAVEDPKKREMTSRPSNTGSLPSQDKPAPRGATGRNEQEPSAMSTQHEDRNRNERDHSSDIAGDFKISERDLNSLEEEDEIASSGRGQASYSETDEDEDEGLGDGNIGRSVRSRGLDEEG